MKTGTVGQKTGRVVRTVSASAILLAAVWVAPAWTQQPDTQAAAVPADFVQLVQPLLPAVVNISTERAPAMVERPPEPPERSPDSPLEEFFRRFFGPSQMTPDRGPVQSGLASGFIIDPEGFIVTNEHVVRGAASFTVTLHDGRQFDAELIGQDDLTELALLKVDAPEPLPAARWGDSDGTQVGEWAVAVGNPFGLGNTVTVGVVSARARDIGIDPPIELLQTDASLNLGNSGGPMFNRQGEVVGVNVAILSPTGGNIGIGFAIPSAVARPVIDQMRQTGEIRRGWLGVGIQGINEPLARHFGLAEPQGVLVTQVTPGGPAERGGLQAGDVVLSYDGQPVEDGRDLQMKVAETEIGRTAPVEILRNDQRTQIQVPIGDRREALAEREEDRVPAPEVEPPGGVGMTLAPITPAVRQMLGLGEEVSGAAVVDIQPGAMAAQGGLRPGDVIVRVGGQDVGHPTEVTQAIEQAMARNEESVLMMVRRDEANLFVALPLQPA